MAHYTTSYLSQDSDIKLRNIGSSSPWPQTSANRQNFLDFLNPKWIKTAWREAVYDPYGSPLCSKDCRCSLAKLHTHTRNIRILPVRIDVLVHRLELYGIEIYPVQRSSPRNALRKSVSGRT